MTPHNYLLSTLRDVCKVKFSNSEEFSSYANQIIEIVLSQVIGGGKEINLNKFDISMSTDGMLSIAYDGKLILLVSAPNDNSFVEKLMK